MRKTDIILLASGNSRRYGSENKLLAQRNGKPMFAYAVDLVIEVKQALKKLVGEIVIVSKYKEIEDYVSNKKEVFYQSNANSEKGISESIHIGVQVTCKDHCALFLVCDQPELKKETLCRLILEFAKSNKKAGVVINTQGKMGNPCVFASFMRQQLLELTGDTGGKQILRNLLEEECMFVEAEDAELIDIDYFT